MKRKSILVGSVLAAGILLSVLMPAQAAASCFCLSTRFTATGSAGGSTCSQAQSNLISNLTLAVDQSCMFRGYSGACNIVIRTGACTAGSSEYLVDGTAKYSCSLCSSDSSEEPPPFF